MSAMLARLRANFLLIWPASKPCHQAGLVTISATFMYTTVTRGSSVAAHDIMSLHDIRVQPSLHLHQCAVWRLRGAVTRRTGCRTRQPHTDFSAETHLGMQTRRRAQPSVSAASVDIRCPDSTQPVPERAPDSWATAMTEASSCEVLPCWRLTVVPVIN
jgi:hypothetical protein